MCWCQTWVFSMFLQFDTDFLLQASSKIMTILLIHMTYWSHWSGCWRHNNFRTGNTVTKSCSFIDKIVKIALFCYHAGFQSWKYVVLKTIKEKRSMKVTNGKQLKKVVTSCWLSIQTINYIWPPWNWYNKLPCWQSLTQY